MLYVHNNLFVLQDQRNLVIVFSPLRALIHDQLTRLEQAGIKGLSLVDCSEEGSDHCYPQYMKLINALFYRLTGFGIANYFCMSRKHGKPGNVEAN